jgi:hypothetical protein
MKAIFCELLSIYRNFNSYVMLADRNIVTHIWNDRTKQARIFKDWLSVFEMLIIDAES